MGTVVSRLKSGGSWDPMIGRFSWWVLDGPPMMEQLIEPVINRLIPSIEQLSFACSLIRNCTFKYDNGALSRVVMWGNSIRQKSYEHRHDASLSSLLGKSIQHVHRYAAFIQTLEYGLDICMEFIDHFKEFPSDGNIDQSLIERIDGMFHELFHEQIGVDKQVHQLLNNDQVVVRAIDLVSGLLQQMKILMDDTHAPVWNGSSSRSVVVLPISTERNLDVDNSQKKKKRDFAAYVSNERLHRIAVEVLLFPSLCFTVTQLHKSSLLHNALSTDIRVVLEHLVKCELLECVSKGIKTTRRSTSVYVKRLPLCDHDGRIRTEQRMIFDEKLNEYRFHHPNFTLNEYLKKNTTISLDATGFATDELVNFFSLPEYMMIELNPLYNLKESGNTKQTTTNTNDVDVQDKLSNNSSTVFNDFEYNQHITTDSVPLITLTNSDDVACMFDDALETITRSYIGKKDIPGSKPDNSMYHAFITFSFIYWLIYKVMHSMSICQNDTSQINVLLNDNTEQSENIAINNIDSSSGGATTLHRSAVDNVLADEPKTKEKKERRLVNKKHKNN
ncbi:unnamed protein product [Rotaria magnacalcarata]|uniref:Uncharacterized protein n=1 Tax=Rotaria magnacalcarata TaxID=392030 RepID=A0A816VF49_9BILA|nr:unnamed protein product [Rotaria magnacalcarata]CAF4603006.1 unnamed protein product [Rotaria magnacalcarata]